MAVFGMADVDLPIITHMAQVDPNDEDELRHLIAVVSWQGNEHLGERRTWHLPPEFGSWHIPHGKRQLSRLREMCRTAQGMLENLVERGGVTAEQQRALIRFNKGLDFVFADPSNEEWLPARKMLEKSDSDMVEHVWGRFVDELKGWVLINPWLGLRLPLKRCRECQGIFYTQEGGRRFYCSHRCGNRASIRRRRAAKKEAVSCD